MKKPLLFILAVCCFWSASAQKSYFIYLEAAAPFYVKLADRVYSASDANYLIIPNLTDSIYTLYVGFTANKNKVARFQVKLNGADKGFFIKSNDGNLLLENLETQQTVFPEKDAAANITYQLRSDAFTQLLSQAAGDSSLLYVPQFVKAETKPKEKSVAASESVSDNPLQNENAGKAAVETRTDTTLASIANNTPLQQDTTLKAVKGTTMVTMPADSTGAPVQMEAAEVPESTYRKSEVKRYAESSTTEGFSLVFIDYGNTTDTIRIVIPNAKYIFQQRTVPDSSASMFLDLNKNALSQQGHAVEDSSSATKLSGVIPAMPECKRFATKNDFFKLRRDMAAQFTDEGMVDVAKKYFKTKCYTVEQVKNLSSLFLTSAGKYLLFDAAFRHVSDPEHFATLEAELQDDYYIRRFKALIGA